MIRPALPRPRRRGPRWVAIGIALAGLVAVLDAVLMHVVLASLFVVAPLALVLGAGPGAVAIVAGLSFALAALSGFWDDTLGTAQYFVPLAVVGAGGVIAVLATLVRVGVERNQRRLELLAGVGEVADGALSLPATIERVGDLLVPRLADACCVDAVSDDGELRRLGARVRSGDPTLDGAAEAALRRRPDVPPGTAATARTGRSQLVEPVDDEALGAPTDADPLRRLHMRAALSVPLSARGRLVGVLSLIACGTGGRFSAPERRFAEVLGGRVALALDNAGLSAELSSAEQRLAAILANLDEAVTVQDANGRMRYANQAAADLLGFAAPDELLEQPPGAVLERFEVSTQDGEPIELADLPAARLLRGAPAPPMLVRNVVRATGEERWLLNRANAIREPGGRVALVVNVIENLTEAKRAEIGQRMLAEASRLLAASLDPERGLREVARRAVPPLADWCAVDLPGPDGRARLVAVAHADPAKEALARELRDRRPVALDGADGLARVLRGEGSLVRERIADEDRRPFAAEEEQGRLRALGLESVMIVPMLAGGRTIGALSFGSAQPERFGRADLELAEELGRRAGAAVHSARLNAERAEIAHTLQTSLLPSALPAVPGWRAASLYRPVGEANEVGGDFYDGFETADGWWVVVGDVAGKGARAAALTAQARHTLRTAGRLSGEIGTALAELNGALCAEGDLALCTVVVVRLESSAPSGRPRATLACAGHPPAVLVRGGEPRFVGAIAPVLGAFTDAAWPEIRLELEPRDTLLLYTDGVLDTVGERERFGEARLLEALRHAPDDPHGLIGRLDGALDAFQRGPQRDDTAAVAVRWDGLAPPGARPDVDGRDEVSPGGEAPFHARALVRERLAGRVPADVLETALVLVSELVANAVRHGGGAEGEPVVVHTRLDRKRLRIEVCDDGPGFRPVAVRTRPHGGFGLVLVSEGADRWGVRRGAGTCVWFELDRRDGGP